jgi:acyl carrier protein phosphodiesterase
MNFLAHALLSGQNELVLTGNMIGDTVKGTKFHHYPSDMQKGILLHRFIDQFTDSHPLTSSTRALLRARFGKYSGVVSDVLYDHFLAEGWNQYHDNLSLPDFASQTYAVLNKNLHLMNEKAHQFIPYMIEQDWLSSYATREGIADVLIRMSRRTKFDSSMEQGMLALEENGAQLAEHFHLFFPELQRAANLELNRLTDITN